MYLVVLGTTEDGGLIGLNLAAFCRIRLDGDPATAAALVNRWVLELLATHPAITVGVTADVWRGPLTTRVRPVAAGRVPDVDVLVCGGELTYAERAQIVAAATSPILLDLGRDAAVSTTWTITCGPDRLGQISRGASRPMTATLIIPSAGVVDRCTDLLVAPFGAPLMASDDGLGDLAEPDIVAAELPEIDASAPLLGAHAAPAADGAGESTADGIDFFAPAQVPRRARLRRGDGLFITAEHRLRPRQQPEHLSGLLLHRRRSHRHDPFSCGRTEPNAAETSPCA